ncbi:hypothetical protein [Burkholderia gladioli]|uniref:hypothetical protein n=1 Tax=Burkholderia gladioli TaxID=28095 RepID=UPI00163FE93D|nr:hypothetical protein [Burkholderia gladioli]
MVRKTQADQTQADQNAGKLALGLVRKTQADQEAILSSFNWSENHRAGHEVGEQQGKCSGNAAFRSEVIEVKALQRWVMMKSVGGELEATPGETSIHKIIFQLSGEM